MYNGRRIESEYFDDHVDAFLSDTLLVVHRGYVFELNSVLVPF